ncbi:HAD family hydrolase [Breznakiella homolactica]|uniref:phosphoglycolate phosphatase n=1 Tax=Breznakiella homolactica TaxID=2798577 RepID=A0A7T7XQZ9_9SPIR|nr:HAD family hydrolase [Breznakiella homolactica]QQO10868.1 HAD family hydrolase [Breznakiella homolactica]
MKNLADKGIDSILFDLDGTLWDATIACAQAWNKSFEECGYKNTIGRKLIRKISGSPLDVVLTEYFTFIKEKDYERVIKQYQKNEPQYMQTIGGRLFPNVRATLQKLRSHKKLFIVSNCLKGYIENFIEKKSLEKIFTGYKSSGETGQAKKENIKMIITEYKLKSPVYVGDTQWDFEASKGNNIPFIYAKYGFGEINNAGYEIKNIKDLLELIR